MPDTMTDTGREIDNDQNIPRQFNDSIVDTTLDYDTTMDSTDNSSGDEDHNVSASVDTIERKSVTKKKTNKDLQNEVQQHLKLPELNSPSNGQPDVSTELEDTSDDSSDSDSDDSLEDEDEEDDEEPPKLKYSRLSKLPKGFFNRDEVSCSYFHEKVFIFATHTGFILLTKPDFTVIRRLSLRQGRQTPSILALHCDGEYFIAGANNGLVLVGSIDDEKDFITYDFKRPIHAVALDRHYKTTKAFISGGKEGKVIYSTRNWLGQRVDTILEQGNGSITMIKAIDDLLLWSNDSGISIAQITARAIIHHEPIPEGFPQPEIYWPKVHYSDQDRIIVGWPQLTRKLKWNVMLLLKTC
ncbi:unnamed protein product [Ambrosiozyma monospora]|uniref:Unnamed protein product n=1 Tax=Ambrosiozyma monospora TaxID=43982 RepID=A0ACB5TL51_AMBMO|nr:unnamed protein product [Ambrosiozyma monospora]